MNGHPIASGLAVTAGENPAERLTWLFDAHYDRLYRLARRLVPSADDARDLVQETFLKTANSLKSVPSGNASQEEAWLVRVLINIRRDQWRKAGVRYRHDAKTGHDGHDRQNPESALIAKATVWQALDRLHPRRRAIVVMHELEGMPVPAIASLLGITAITVRWHLSVGLKDLKRALQPFMGGPNENR
jgi:RNA polymerase sigma factor (sigma-70 family)